MRHFFRISTAVLFAASPALTLVSHAATSSADLGVSAEVAANCTISAGALAFGAYDPVTTNAASPAVGTGTVSVRCTLGADVTIELDEGLNEAGGSAPDAPLRRLVSGGSFLHYFLYANPERTQVWGTGEEAGVEETGTGGQVVLTVYGTIPGAQVVPEGDYEDTVVATVTF